MIDIVFCDVLFVLQQVYTAVDMASITYWPMSVVGFGTQTSDWFLSSNILISILFLLVFTFCGLVQSSVIYLVLKYVVDWVDGQVAFLEAKDTAILFSFCVRLLEIYSAHNIGKVPFESLIFCLVYLFEILNSK